MSWTPVAYGKMRGRPTWRMRNITNHGSCDDGKA
jgi:hypothetical protein